MPTIEGKQARIQLSEAQVTSGAKEFETVQMLSVPWGQHGTRSCSELYSTLHESLDSAPALPRERLQTMIGGALAEVYFSHARLAAYVALTMCIIGLTIGGPSASS